MEVDATCTIAARWYLCVEYSGGVTIHPHFTVAEKEVTGLFVFPAQPGSLFLLQVSGNLSERHTRFATLSPPLSFRQKSEAVFRFLGVQVAQILKLCIFIHRFCYQTFAMGQHTL